ncbi:DJ-1/PfpI family protein [Gluconacetobacter asukensis]|uniref:DJ-1/PfpI family protein n=1 Tax=Gluconacetobacter asukensis TaxID=1017181 RepID=A0A7W4J391_9PROT|nr:DJ-1/PfpI family protein [Gluconacetobacter asukensis]MBB2173812.1 DJ-1/PfpI family protein [Gluconacetobacter asukensis]
MADTNPAPDPLEIGIILYPGFTLLDLAGPQSALGLHGRTQFFARTLDPVVSDTGAALVPTATFTHFEGRLDVLLVPGGFGTNDAMRDEALRAFLVRVAPSAGYLCSVCSGSLILGTAGLLANRRATTHWTLFEALEAVGAATIHERVVNDENIWTGGGVTAGIDFGLKLLAELRGEDVAKLTQLMMEYDPEPPFATGNPQAAGPALVSATYAAMGEGTIRETVSIAAARAAEMRA